MDTNNIPENKWLEPVLAHARWKRVGPWWRTPDAHEVTLVGPDGPALRLYAADRHIEALLAKAILEARTFNGDTVATVLLKKVTSAQHARCVAFVRRVAPEAAWLLADVEGRCFIHAFGEYEAPEPRASRPTRTPVNLFSDLHQWLAKVLLAPYFPEKWLRAPRGTYRSAVALAEAADVSVPAATRFVRALDEQGWLDDQPVLSLGAPGEYLRHWATNLGAAQTHPYRRAVMVRSVRGPLDEPAARALLRRVSVLEEDAGSSPHFWLRGGLFTACNELGLGHVTGAPPTLVAPELTPAALEARGLVIDDKGQPGSALLRVARYRESVSRGAVVANGVPVTDVIQCWLDASTYALRGQEQADVLWRKAILPSLGDHA